MSPIPIDSGMTQLQSSDTSSLQIDFTGKKSPADAPVFIDGVSVGALGQAIQVEPGEHTVRIGSPPFCSQVVVVDVKRHEALLFTCNRTWLMPVSVSLLLLAAASLLPGKYSHTWHPLESLEFLGVDALVFGFAWMMGDRWLSVRQSSFHPDSPRLRIVYGGTRISSSSPPPIVYIDGRRAGMLDEEIVLPTGTHKVRVGGWTVSSNELEIGFDHGQNLIFTCKESGAAWIVLAIVSALMAAAGIVLFWLVDRGRFEFAGKEFFGSLVIAAILCTFVSRFVPTMKIELTDASKDT